MNDGSDTKTTISVGWKLVGDGIDVVIADVVLFYNSITYPILLVDEMISHKVSAFRSRYHLSI